MLKFLLGVLTGLVIAAGVLGAVLYVSGPRGDESISNADVPAKARSRPTEPVKPTEAQIEAVRNACAGDFKTACPNTEPHGWDALQCLQKNLDSLASSCQAAVKAIGSS